MTEFYTCDEVASKLKVKASTVWGWIRQGRLGAVRIGKSYRITAKDIQAMIHAGAQKKSPLCTEKGTKKAKETATAKGTEEVGGNGARGTGKAWQAGKDE